MYLEFFFPTAFPPAAEDTSTLPRLGLKGLPNVQPVALLQFCLWHSAHTLRSAKPTREDALHMSCFPTASGPFGMLLPPPRMPHKTLLLLQQGAPASPFPSCHIQILPPLASLCLSYSIHKVGLLLSVYMLIFPPTLSLRSETSPSLHVWYFL